ncbi:MAG: methyltransferase domain-containing protein [Candidatus Heimdallarchaeota archaeon]
MGKIKETVKDSYAKKLEKAKGQETACCESTESKEEEACCDNSQAKLQLRLKDEIPSFGCIYDLPGKAGLKEGDTVVDFGSGPGHDLIRAAELVGKTGKAIGIDMTEEMIKNATDEINKKGLTNAEVKLGEIENVPLEDNIADVVISNCVINLSADKLATFCEAFRILKPGGRLVDGDVIAEHALPKSIQKDNESWCSCVGGALTKDGYIEAITKAGFVDIQIDKDHSRPIIWQGEKIELYSGLITAKKPIN